MTYDEAVEAMARAIVTEYADSDHSMHDGDRDAARAALAQGGSDGGA